MLRHDKALNETFCELLFVSDIILDFKECAAYSCLGYLCEENQTNNRTCICPPGRSGTATLIGNATFEGCKGVNISIFYFFQINLGFAKLFNIYCKLFEKN